MRTHDHDAIENIMLGGLAASHCQGRLVVVNVSGLLGRSEADPGRVVFDSRFTSAEPDANIECYGVAPSTGADGGWVLSCGTGVEPELHPGDSKVAKTWRVLLHRADAHGTRLWETNYTDNTQLHDNAGENIFGVRDGALL
jgi:hypothetical protein